ncbi:uncharacterized protein LOC126908867 isoform X3 [Daktulosphaira vitifoliae]|uniref:uncharacterized protein LOC126908867 isoform X3 n=1 Tax=Daktulosphaira vitifoliae TaxID=58002 RepID=UPI0021A9EB62|nr:uncharacterized protein LOC126908867 isoform X3 [Daktulosphaira vitifoliae]
MNSLTIFMIILVLAIDFSLAFECSGCGKVKLLQMVSCRHYFCNTCRNKITQCNMCKEYFKIGNSENTTGVNLLKCSNCSEVYKLRVSSCSHIHCNYCISNLLGCTICKINFSDAQILSEYKLNNYFL